MADDILVPAVPQSHRLADSVWNFGDAKDTISLWVKDQAVELIEKLCGRQPKITNDLTGSLCVLVGTVDNNRFVEQAATEGLIDVSSLATDDYYIKQATIDGKPVLLIAGKNPRAAMYGVFDFFEQLGCRFLISRDVVPETLTDLTIPKPDILRHTDNTWRGLGFQYCFATNCMMSLPDYQAMFDQMAKMRMNRMGFFHFNNEPFTDFSYKGERKLIGDISHPDSGYISYGRSFSGSYLVKDIPIGREKYGVRKRVAPIEFQDVASSDEALDTGKVFMQRLMKMAKMRGIECWISCQPCYVTPNMTKYTRPMPRIHEHWSAHVSCTDPVVTEINRNKVQNIVDSYPDAEGILFVFPEGHYEDPYPESKELVQRELDNYAEVLSLTKNKKKLEADIRFAEIIKNSLRVAKEVKSDIRLGILAVCKAPILAHLDKTLSKDIQFVDIESGSLWGGNPLHLFKEMKGRECVIVPRAVDDGSLAGLQFNLNLYKRDRFLQSTKENGTRGFMIQTTHIRGNEHNLKYLAEGLWNDKLTPDEFYEDYTQALFGPEASELVVQAFNVLEENEAFLGGRGGANMPWCQMPPEILALQPIPGRERPFYWKPHGNFQKRGKKFRESIKYLTKAGKLFEEAKNKATETGWRELHYLINRNKAYIHHLETLAQIDDIYAGWQDAIKTRHAGEKQTRGKLQKTVAMARKAEEEAAKSARSFAECAEHPTDLGVLWMVNTKMVIGTRVIRQHLNNLLAFYNGQEYWKKVDWDLLFGKTPYPAYDLKTIKNKDSNVVTFEPG